MSRKKRFNVSCGEGDVGLSLSCVYQSTMTVTLLTLHTQLKLPDCCTVNNHSFIVMFIKIDILIYHYLVNIVQIGLKITKGVSTNIS